MTVRNTDKREEIRKRLEPVLDEFDLDVSYNIYASVGLETLEIHVYYQYDKLVPRNKDGFIVYNNPHMEQATREQMEALAQDVTEYIRWS